MILRTVALSVAASVSLGVNTLDIQHTVCELAQVFMSSLNQLYLNLWWTGDLSRVNLDDSSPPKTLPRITQQHMRKWSRNDWTNE